MSAIETLASLVMEDGHRWGEVATPVQWEDAEAILDTPGGPRRHWVSRARGYSKTDDLAGMTLAVMLEDLVSTDEVLAFARDRDQAQILVRRLAGFVSRTPELRGAVSSDTYTATTRAGVRLEAFEMDPGSAWGRKPAWAVADELCQWPQSAASRTVLEAVTTSLPKHPRSRFVVITTSGDPAHFSKAFHDHAVEDELWRVSSTSGPAPWQDPRELASERRRLPEPSWRRLFLNEWASGSDRLVSEEDLLACVRLSADEWPRPPLPGRMFVMGLDVGLVDDRCVLSVCSSGPEDGYIEVVLDDLEVWYGSKLAAVPLDEVERAILHRWERFGRPPLIFDPHEAIHLTQRLEARGVECVPWTFTQQSNARLAMRMHSLVRARQLALPPNEALLDELRTVQLVETAPNLWRVDHLRGRHDDMVVSIGMAALLLGDGPVVEDRVVFYDPSTDSYVDDPALVDRVRISPY